VRVARRNLREIARFENDKAKRKGEPLAPLFLLFFAVCAANPDLLGFLTRGLSVIVMPVMVMLPGMLAMVPIMRRRSIGALGR